MDPTPASPLPATRAPRPGLLTAGVATYAAAYVAWLAFNHWSEPVQAIVKSVAFLPLNLVAGFTFLLAARGPRLDGRVRRSLAFFGAGALAIFVGSTIAAVQLHVLHVDPTWSWPNLFYIGDTVLVLLGLFAIPVARSDRAERWRFLLDAGIVVLGGGISIWYFGLVPVDAATSSLANQLIAASFPLASMLLLTGITTALVRRPTDPNTRALQLVLTGLIAGIVADLVYALVLNGPLVQSRALTDAGYALGYVLMVAGAECYLRFPIPRRTTVEAAATPRATFSPVAVVAVCVVYGLLVTVALRHRSSELSQIAVASALLTLLVLWRLVVTADDNARLLGEAAARATEARFRSLVQHSSDVITIVATDATVLFASPSAAHVLGLSPEQLVGGRLSDLMHPDDRPRALGFLAEAANEAGLARATSGWRLAHADGSWRTVETVATNLLADPSVRGLVLNTRDVSERHALEQQLLHQAFHDPLTGLANRALFRDRVGHALALAGRHGRPLGVLFLDLDDFKRVNDSLGHAVGDELLVGAAERLKSCARTSDTVARLGGDEFAILVEDMADGLACRQVAERVVQAMQRPFPLAGREVVVSASVGVAGASGSETADDLLRNADLAMYIAKSRGKGCHETFESAMHANVLARLELEADLRRALEEGELAVHYQPIVDLATGALYGVEALARWQHSTRGLLAPSEFISVAEETGLIVPLGARVLREAVRQAREWARAVPEHPPIAISVNLAARQLQSDGFIDELRAVLAESALDSSSLVLELTESMLMEHTPVALERLHALRALGVRLAIDDFGTGYSSLSYLQRFPLDILKIAKPFVDTLAPEHHEHAAPTGSESALARAVITLCETLNLRTIAEGVEREGQRVELIALGCQLGQGYRFAPPMSGAEIEQLLRHDSAAAAVRAPARLVGIREVERV